MVTPLANEIRKFIEEYDKITKFEAQHFLGRGHGVYSPEERAAFPIPEVRNVYNWLRGLAGIYDI